VKDLLVIAREDERDHSLASEADRMGYEVLRAALLATEPGKDLDRCMVWLRETPPPKTAIAWTSRRAARALVDALRPAGADKPTDARDSLAHFPLFAVGVGSAAPVRELGLEVLFVTEHPSAAALARLILDRREALGIERVAFLHGNRALPDLPATLRAAGLHVEEFEVYRTRFLTPDLAPLESALGSGRNVWIFYYSPSGIEALERHLRPETLEPLRKRGRAVALGATTRAALQERGYARLEAGMAGLTASASRRTYNRRWRTIE